MTEEPGWREFSLFCHCGLDPQPMAPLQRRHGSRVEPGMTEEPEWQRVPGLAETLPSRVKLKNHLGSDAIRSLRCLFPAFIVRMGLDLHQAFAGLTGG